MRRTEHVACIGKKLEAYGKGREEKGKELSVNVRIIWKWISKKYGVCVCVDWIKVAVLRLG
jgi:hypothetical protein